uniref:Uncharacterized protein n=1 Tax=Lotharella oceanica TaxID=641309 RepID=A0A7S2TI98_9EUKA
MQGENEIAIWASRFYSREGNDKWSCARAKAVAGRVRQEFSVSKSEVDIPDKKFARIKSDANTESRGVFRIAKSRLFSTPKTVCWLHKSKSICTLICEEHANVLLAANQLGMLANSISTHFGPNALQDAKIINGRPEEFHMLLDRMMPSGHLQYLTQVDATRELALLANVLQKSKS